MQHGLVLVTSAMALFPKRPPSEVLGLGLQHVIWGTAAHHDSTLGHRPLLQQVIQVLKQRHQKTLSQPEAVVHARDPRDLGG